MIERNGQRPGLDTWLVRGAVAVIFVYLLAPITIIAILSFSSAQSLVFPPPGFDFKWYERFLGDPNWRQSIYLSVEIALLATVIATTAGLFAALSVVRGSYPGKMIVYGLMLTPMIVPNIITAIAFYMAFAKYGASGSKIAMAIGHAVLAMPIVFIILSANLKNIDRRYEWAALSLGASPLFTLRTVLLPLLAPGLISAALFSFLTSFDELLIALFLSGVKTQTLSVRMWNSMTLSLEPTIAAVSVFLMTLTALALTLDAVVRRGEK